MKKQLHSLKQIAVLLLSVGLFMSCAEDGPKDLNIVSMTIDSFDLNGAQSPSDVPVSPTITVTFNTDIEPTTATAANITLTQDYDDANIELNIAVSGPTLTLTPVNPLGTGTLYALSLGAGLLNSDDQPLATTSRSFTTTGTFSPSGLIAHWKFEDSAEDVVGTYDPIASAVVDINYVDSRNSAAGRAADFNGTTSIIEVPNGDELITTDDFTISFWVKANSTDKTSGHFVMGLGAFYGIQFEIFGGYDGAKFAIQYEFADGTSGGEDMWFPSEATDNSNGGWQGWDYARSLTVEQMTGLLKDQWLQVTYTFDASDRKGVLYYNGEKMKSFDFDLWPDEDPKRTTVGLTYAGQTPDVVNELAFGFIHSRAGTMWDSEPWGGYDFPGANHFKGQLDDIKIWHKPLTETEITLMYDSEK